MQASRRHAPRVAALVLGAAAVVLASVSTTPSEATTTPAAPTGTSTASPSPSPKGTFPQTVTSAEGVDVTTYGVVQVRPNQDPTSAPVTLAVHGVQRVPGGTVVYLSAGYTDAKAKRYDNAITVQEPGSGPRFQGGSRLGGIRIADLAGGMVYATVTFPDADQVGRRVPFGSPTEAYQAEQGTMGVLYAVLPPLPASTTTVSVTVGRSAIIPGVPVRDGLLEPTRDPDGVIPLGTGWPRIDTADIARVSDAAQAVFPLTSIIAALDGSRVNREGADQVTIDIAGDVLFEFDSAALSGQAQATLDGIATEIAKRAAPGTLSIVGHTDSIADDAYNDDLSLRRAQSVADVLSPRLSGQGLNVVVEGRGEREPVGDNSTDEGRQANRRVSVTFSLAAQGTP